MALNKVCRWEKLLCSLLVLDISEKIQMFVPTLIIILLKNQGHLSMFLGIKGSFKIIPTFQRHQLTFYGAFLFSVNLCDGCSNDSVSIIFTDEKSFTVTSALKSLSMTKADYSIITGELGFRKAEG